MSAGADIAWRLGLKIAASAAAFVIALYAVKAARGLGRRDVAAAAAAYWGIFAADMTAFVAARSGRPVSTSHPFTIAIYMAVLVWAVYAARRGMARGVLAAAAGVPLGWFLNILFARAYEIALK